MSVLKSRRLGRFRLAIELINEMPEAARVVTSQLTAIVRSTVRVEMSDIEYVALCEAFPEVPEGNQLPLYAPTLRKRTDGTIEFCDWIWGDRPVGR